MQFFIRKPWDLPQRLHTPIEIFENRRQHRREFLRALGVGAAGALLWTQGSGCAKPTDEEIEQGGAVEPLPPAQAGLYPARPNDEFEYGRPETARRAAAEFTNFYEFSGRKDSWQHVGAFQTSPWSLTVDGLCAKPRTFDLDELHQLAPFEERAYRFRCVEAWAMCVPWTGFPLRALLKSVEPKPEARYVAFQTFNKPDEAPGIRRASDLPWPYTEGLTIEEASNELAFLTFGIYGRPLPKQHGAPVRVIVPWKYGFKGAKSLVKITLTDQRPATFWNTLAPHEYGFEANVDPDVPHPRWSQRTEWMLGTRERFDTVKFNGYGDYVGKIYST